MGCGDVCGVCACVCVYVCECESVCVCVCLRVHITSTATILVLVVVILLVVVVLCQWPSVGWQFETNNVSTVCRRGGQGERERKRNR
jgi:hypothetical protein